MKTTLSDIKRQLVKITQWLAFIAGLLIAQTCTSKADDPNLTIDKPSANCNGPTNVQDIKAILKEIRNNAMHPNANFIHLHNKERNIIRKKLPEQPSLEVYLR